MVGSGIGERASDMSEQFTFEKRLRNGSRIHADKRSCGAGGKRMDFACEHVFSGSVLSCNQHRGISRGDFHHILVQALHLRATAPEHLRFPAGRFVLLCWLFPVSYLRKRPDEFRVVPRFHDEILRPALHALHRQGDVGIGREQHHSLPGPSGLEFRQPI